MTKNDIALKVRASMQDKKISLYFLEKKKKISYTKLAAVLQIGKFASRDYTVGTLIEVSNAVGCKLF